MSLQILKDHLARELEAVEIDGNRYGFLASDENSDCTIHVKLKQRVVSVLMNYDDAIPFDASRGRMTLSKAAIRLKIRKPDGGSEIFEVSRAGRNRDGKKLLEYTARGGENPELLRIVMLMVAIFKKAAERAA